MKQQGQGTLQREVEEEVQAVKGNAKAFYTHITGIPYPDGLSPALETVADKLGGGKNWQVTSSGNQPGGEPEKAIDGDAGSNWHTPWDTSTKENRHPHTLGIDFGRVISVSGLKLTGRTSGVNGRIKDFVIWTRAEGVAWKQVKKGDLPDIAEPQTVRFSGRVSTRHLRIESLSSHHGDFTSLAEVNVIY
ncbi:MAG: discoidin domain-containing protein [Akkermansiaceae bacterium]|nr:discoidin domain-containing protein [Akkermansiaceae bacterium]